MLHPPGVEEDELEIEGGPEHEHVVVELDLGVGAGRQGVADRDEADVVQLVTRLRAVLATAARQRHVLQLQVARTVDHLRRHETRVALLFALRCVSGPGFFDRCTIRAVYVFWGILRERRVLIVVARYFLRRGCWDFWMHAI